MIFGFHIKLFHDILIIEMYLFMKTVSLVDFVLKILPLSLMYVFLIQNRNKNRIKQPHSICQLISTA